MSVPLPRVKVWPSGLWAGKLCAAQRAVKWRSRSRIGAEVALELRPPRRLRVVRAVAAAVRRRRRRRRRGAGPSAARRAARSPSVSSAQPPKNQGGTPSASQPARPRQRWPEEIAVPQARMRMEGDTPSRVERRDGQGMRPASTLSVPCRCSRISRAARPRVAAREQRDQLRVLGVGALEHLGRVGDVADQLAHRALDLGHRRHEPRRAGGLGEAEVEEHVGLPEDREVADLAHRLDLAPEPREVAGARRARRRARRRRPRPRRGSRAARATRPARPARPPAAAAGRRRTSRRRGRAPRRGARSGSARSAPGAASSARCRAARRDRAPAAAARPARAARGGSPCRAARRSPRTS